MKKLLVLAVLAAALIATPAMAKEGVYLGAELVYNTIQGSDFDYYDSAGGLGIKVGYNFGSIAIEGNIFKSTHSATGYIDVDFSGASVDARISFSQTNDPDQVYALIGLGAYTLEDPSAKLTGSGLNLGVGLEHFFNQQVALNLAGIYRFIDYDKMEAGGVTYTLSPESNGDVFTLAVGLNLYF